MKVHFQDEITKDKLQQPKTYVQKYIRTPLYIKSKQMYKMKVHFQVELHMIIHNNIHKPLKILVLEYF